MATFDDRVVKSSLPELKLEIDTELKRRSPGRSTGLRALQRELRETENFFDSAAELLTERQETQQQERLVTTYPSWQRTIQMMPDFDQVPFEIQSQRYEEWLEGLKSRIKVVNPDAEEFEIDEQIRRQHPAPERPTRTFIEGLEDIGRRGVAGAVATGQLAAQAVAPGSEVSESLRNVGENLREGLSEAEKDAMLQQAYEIEALSDDPDLSAIGRFGREIAIAGRNLTLAGFAEILGNVLPTVVVGGGAGGIAARAALAANRNIGTRALAWRAAAPGIGMNIAIQGGQSSQVAYDTIKNAPVEELEQADDWQDYLDQANGDVDEARELMARRSARLAQGLGSAFAIATSTIPAHSLQRVVGRSAIGQRLGGVSSLAGTALVEATEEAGVTAAGQAVPSLQIGTPVGPGLGEAFGLGAIGGAGAGAVAGGFGAAVRKWGRVPQQDRERFQEQVQDELRKAARENAHEPGQQVNVGDPNVTVVMNEDGTIGYGEDSNTSSIADLAIQIYNQERQDESTPQNTERVLTQALTSAGVEAGEAQRIAQQELSLVGGEAAQPSITTPDEVADIEVAEEPAPPEQVEVQFDESAFDQELGPEIIDAPVITETEQSNADTFNEALSSEVETINNRLAQIVTNIFDSPLAPETLQAIETEVENIDPQFWNSDILPALAELQGQEIDPQTSPLGYAVSELGLGITQENARNQPWARAVRETESTQQALEAVRDDTTAGTLNRELARIALEAFEQTGTELPALNFSEVVTDNEGRPVLAKYEPRLHRIETGNETSPQGFLHEVVHSLTTRGWRRIQQEANNGNQRSQDIIALGDHIFSRLQEVDQSGILDAARTDSMEEVMAQLTSPTVLALAARTEIGQITDPAAQRALSRMAGNQNTSVFDVIVRMIQTALRTIGITNISDNSLVRLLSQVASEAAVRTTEDTAAAQPVETAVETEPAPEVPEIPDTAVPEAPVQPTTPVEAPPETPAPADPDTPPSAPQEALPEEQVIELIELEELDWRDASLEFDAVTDKAIYTATLPASQATEVTPLAREFLEARGLSQDRIRAAGRRLRAEIAERYADGERDIQIQPDELAIARPRNPGATPGVSASAQRNQEAGQASADGLVSRGEGPIAKPESVPRLIQMISNREEVEAATAPRRLVQAMRQDNNASAWEKSKEWGETANYRFHDVQFIGRRFAETLPEGEGGVEPLLKQRLWSTMYLALGKKGDILRQMETESSYGDLRAQLYDLSKKYNMAPESVWTYVGYYLTARWAPKGNQRLVQGDTLALQEAQRNLDRLIEEGQPQAEIDLAQDAVREAQQNLADRIEAVNNPNVDTETHKRGVAGFTDPVADSMGRISEQLFEASDLEAIASLVYQVNAYRTMIDIESGKWDTAVVANFLQQPELKPLFDRLRDAAEGAREAGSQDASAQETLAALRREVLEKIENEYVPLSGDPETAMDTELFLGDTTAAGSAPRNYKLEGRTKGLPDNGISTTIASLAQSAAYAGWAPFLDTLNEVYNSLSQENREAVGIERVAFSNDRDAPGNALVRRRGGQAQAFYFADPRIMEGFRRSNQAEQDVMLGWLGKITKAYSYAATQLNALFGPTNTFRDFWERSEVVRGIEGIVDRDGNPVNMDAVARSMLAETRNLGSIFRGTFQFGFGRSREQIAKTKAGRAMLRLIEEGGVAMFGEQFESNRQQLVANILKETSTRRQLRMLNDLVRGYNRGWELASSTALFMALEENNVDTATAAGVTLDTMNFRKRGRDTRWLNSLYAFANPTIITGANVIGSLVRRDGKPNRRAWVRLATYFIGFTLLQSMFRSLADDDEGGNKLDQESDFQHYNNLLIPVGDGIVRVPLAFGLTRIANSMARAAVGAGSGEIDFKTATGNAIQRGIVPTFSPIETTQIDWSKEPIKGAMSSFAPTWMRPLINVGTNLTPWGTELVPQWESTNEFRSEQFAQWGPEFYSDVAKYLRENLGVDMAPQQIRFLFKAYPTGPGQYILNGMVENPYQEQMGRRTDSAIWRRFYTGYNDAARYFQFQDAIDETDELTRRINAGEQLSSDERRAFNWRQRWNEQDKELRNARRKVTRDGTLTEKAKERRYADNRRRREQAQIAALYDWRNIQGLHAVRTEYVGDMSPVSTQDRVDVPADILPRDVTERLLRQIR